MQDPTSEKWLRLREVAQRFGISQETARMLVVNGQLAARRPTGKRRGMYQVAEAECERYEADMAAGAA
jgi:excisionase family DNA binding protein